MTITVAAVNDAPVAQPGTLAATEDPAHGTLTLNPNGSFTYTPAAGFAGTDTFTYRASDGTATSSPATVSLSVTGGGAGAALVPDPLDPLDPAKTALVVRGTAGNDTITITPSGNSGAVVVKMNGATLGTFNPTGRVIVYGQAGNDDIQTAGAVRRPVWLHGGAGDDRLKGGDGDDVLLGEDGDDLLAGAGGRDLLVGGEGADRIVGNDADDILIAGFTDFDANDHALAAVVAEWTSNRAYALRVVNLLGGFPCLDRANGAVFLTSDTVHDEGLGDVLTGSAGNDWFLFNADGDGGVRDRVTDLSLAEWLSAADIDFIYVDPT